MSGPGAAPGSLDVQVGLDARWLELPVQDGPVTESELDAWAGRLVAQALAGRGATLPPYHRMVLEQLYAATFESVRALSDDERQVLVSACLAPGADLDPVVTVNLSAVSLASGMPTDALVELLLVPEEQRWAEPDVDELATGAGSCLRIRQLVLDPPGGPDDEAASSGLATSLLYVWPTAHDGIYLVLDAYFGSPAEAAVHQPDVDELARTLTVQEVR